ncbi:MAG: hypothetical protein R3D85_03730 [Paracoccaceae bacterium]
MSPDFANDAARHALAVMGLSHDGGDTVVLLGPAEPGFWAHFTAQPEYDDGAPDPMDRWSKRAIGALARAWGGVAVFPSDGPPYPPFQAWRWTAAAPSPRRWGCWCMTPPG